MKLIIFLTLVSSLLFSSENNNNKELIKNGNIDIVLKFKGNEKRLKKIKEIYKCMIEQEPLFAKQSKEKLDNLNKNTYKEIKYLNDVLKLSLFKDLNKQTNIEDFQKTLNIYNIKYSNKCKTNSCKIVFNKYTKDVDNIKDFKETIKISIIESLLDNKFKTIQKKCIQKIIKLEEIK